MFQTGSTTLLDVTRSSQSGNPNLINSPLTVSLAYQGTAHFGSDFFITGINPDGTVTIPAGVASVVIGLEVVPDSRFEGAESVVISAVPPSSGGGGYSSSGEVAEIFITDDDFNSMPASGRKLTDLGTVNGAMAYAYGINTVFDGGGNLRGQVVGQIGNLNTGTNYFGTAGYKWDNGSVSYFFPPASYTSYPVSGAWAINDNGTSVGFVGYTYYNAVRRACVWKGPQNLRVLLPNLFSENSIANTATDVNERDDLAGIGGVVVGNQLHTSGRTHAVAWVPDANGNFVSSPIDLLTLAGPSRDSFANAVNNAGVVVGRSQLASGTHHHAFRSQMQEGIPEPLLLLDDQGTATGVATGKSEALDINDFNELVGASDVVPAGGGAVQYRATYKVPGSGLNQGWIDLGVLGSGPTAGDASVAKSINEGGLIVGQSRFKPGSSYLTRAFVLANQGNVGSQPLLPLTEQAWVLTGGTWQRADTTGWALVSAERVNDANWIVGYGTKAGTTRAFLLTPR